MAATKTARHMRRRHPRPRGSHWSPVDSGMVALARQVLDEDWDPVRSAQHLVEAIGDRRILRRMYARVERALAERPSEVAARASTTLRLALEDGHPRRAPTLSAPVRATVAS
jgi:hypothetical protein